MREKAIGRSKTAQGQQRAMRYNIKVYTGSEAVKKMIKEMAEEDSPGQSTSAYMLRLVWRERKRRNANLGEASQGVGSG